MADDKSFKELIKEVQELNKSITKQNKGRADQLNDLVNAQNKTTEMVTRRLTKAQTAQLEKDNEQIKVAKEESDRQADADKKAQELEDKKFTMKKFYFNQILQENGWKQNVRIFKGKKYQIYSH